MPLEPGYAMTDDFLRWLLAQLKRVEHGLRLREGRPAERTGRNIAQHNGWVQVTGAKTSEVQTITVDATGGYFLVSGAHEVQTVTLVADAGTWFFTAASSTVLQWNATSSAVQVAARAAAGALVTVAGSDGGPYTVTWPDDASHSLLAADGAKLTIHGSTGSVTITEDAHGESGSSTHIAYNDQTVVAAVAGVAVTVTGPNGGPFVLTWPDTSPDAQPLLVLDSSHLTGGTHTASIVETAAGTGGRYPGQWGLDDEVSTDPGVITLQGSPGDIWVRDANGAMLAVDTWYWGRLESDAVDGVPVYVVGLTPLTSPQGIKLYTAPATANDDGSAPVSLIPFIDGDHSSAAQYGDTAYWDSANGWLQIPADADGLYMVGFFVDSGSWVPGDLGSAIGETATNSIGFEVYVEALSSLDEVGFEIDGIVGDGVMLPTTYDSIAAGTVDISAATYSVPKLSGSVLASLHAGDTLKLKIKTMVGNGGSVSLSAVQFWLQPLSVA